MPQDLTQNREKPYNLDFGACCLSMACATILRWTFPVAVLGMTSVKKIYKGVSIVPI